MNTTITHKTISGIHHISLDGALINLQTDKENVLNFFLACFEHGYLLSPTQDSEGFEEASAQKGDEKVYHLSLDKISFQFLKVPKDSEEDNEKNKVEKINQILSKKIVAVLKEGTSRYGELEHRFNMQKKCSTCQAYGITDPCLSDTIILLK